MQANQLTLESHPSGGQTNASFLNRRVSGWLDRVFGCRHREMSRPFSSDGQTYRACLSCGARRDFHIGRWEMRGDFYYSLPAGRRFGALNDLTPRPAKRRATISGIAPSSRQYA